MRIMIACLLTLIPSISLAMPLTFSFIGEMGGKAVNGSFTYETVQSPSAFNVRGLQDNAVYNMSSWTMASGAVSSFAEAIPATTFTPANSTVEFCQGKCIFGSGSQWHTTLRFTSGVVVLQLGFLLGDPTPLSSPQPQRTSGGPFH